MTLRHVGRGGWAASNPRPRAARSRSAPDTGARARPHCAARRHRRRGRGWRATGRAFRPYARRARNGDDVGIRTAASSPTSPSSATPQRRRPDPSGRRRREPVADGVRRDAARTRRRPTSPRRRSASAIGAIASLHHLDHRRDDGRLAGAATLAASNQFQHRYGFAFFACRGISTSAADAIGQLAIRVPLPALQRSACSRGRGRAAAHGATASTARHIERYRGAAARASHRDETRASAHFAPSTKWPGAGSRRNRPSQTLR